MARGPRRGMALPFDLPALSRGFCELGAQARAHGEATAEAAARALATLVAREVSIRGRAVPGAPPPRSPAARVALHLAALPGQAVLEVEPALIVRLVDLLAGGPGAADGATELTPLEASALELFALAAIDAACGIPAVEENLAPRLARGAPEGTPSLAIELDVRCGDVSGRARLLLPLAAVRALRAPPAEEDVPAAALLVPLSVRAGAAALLPDELDALAPGDVVVLDGPADVPEALVLPGGVRLRGRARDGGFHVEEVVMAERHVQLPVTLEVELARIEIAIADLARLEPGQALPLGIDRRGLVTLRAGERAVARGELVELDGVVGVRILSVEVAP